jgi:sugar lactone lactonase YvrE
MFGLRISLFLLCVLLLPAAIAHSQSEIIDFDSDQWIFRNADTSEYMHRKCLSGFAYLKDVEFENGVIEVDVAVDGSRSYPGLIFRMQSPQNYERYYMRPHRMGLYPDAHQYTPVINGIAGWQLYNGEGYTSGGDVPANQWVHLRLEVMGRQARLFIDDAEQPALVINDLQHGLSKGTIGLHGPNDKTAYFSNFRYELTNDLDFPPPPEVTLPLGIIKDWEISQSFVASQLDFEKAFDKQGLTDIEWQKINCEPSGMIDLARYAGRSGPEVDCIWARTTIVSDKAEKRELRFGYSDLVSVFLNGDILFNGTSAYQERDPSFLGIVGLYDAVYLPLNEGENELLLLVAESFGGWGFICQDGDYIYQHENMTKLWEIPRKLRMPESVVYDEERDVLYVSNFFNGGDEFISRISLDGEIIDREWITGFIRPTGMCIYEDKLYVVERMGVAEIDIESGEVIIKYPIPSGGFLNDIAVDESGIFYISDNRNNVIHKLANGESDVWLKGDEIQDPNGLCVDDDMLIIGNSGDGSLKTVSLSNKKVTTLVSLGDGSIMDGVRADGKGKFIISDFNGRVFSISQEGKKTELLNTTVSPGYCADIDYIADKGLILIPSLYDNNLSAYRYHSIR